MPDYLRELHEVTVEDRVLVGGKAAVLGTLLRAGYPVPDGFCITTKAYLDSPQAPGKPGTGTGQDASTGMQEDDVTLAAWPAKLRAEVLQAYRLLRERHGSDLRVAVRSSASLEDLPDASFAGQYTSVMNVADESALLEAIKCCWSSAISAQVHAYRSQRALGDAQTHMAVIVQVMVPPEFAGVLFTVDPMTSDPTYIVIEMTVGLGDTLASGRTMPFRLTIDRQTGRVSHSSFSGLQQTAAYLERMEWRPLFELALQTEELFQAPQDIEWVYSEGKFWLLQSRPITGQSRQPCRHIWTRANVGEIFPNVISPLTWSIFKPILHRAGSYRARSPLTMHHKWKHRCGAWPDSPRIFEGRVYLELASVYASFGGLPGVKPDILQRMLGFEFHLCRPDELPEKHPRWHVMDPYRALRFWLEMLGITETQAKKAHDWLREREDNGPVSLLASGETRPEALLSHVDSLLPRTAQVFGLHLQSTAMAFSALGLLDQFAGKYATTEEVQTFESGLIADFQRMSTIQQVIAIWDLAQVVRHVPHVEKALFEIEASDQVIKAWKSSPQACDFLKLWDAFIDRFGDRSTEELELAVAHWDDDPSFVLQTIRNLLCEESSPDPREKLRRMQAVGQQHFQRMLERIQTQGSKWEVWFFRRLVASYQQNTLLRENLKHRLVTRFNALRKTFVALGKVLEQHALIPDHKSIFFLQYNEIIDLIKNPAELTCYTDARIAQRREDHDKWAKSPASNIWVSMNNYESPMKVPSWNNTDTLEGIGCSAGQIAGTARVFTSLQDSASIGPGQILVVPSIDPGWTPLFLTAGGLVTEIGGVLSHGATVAREYGLPAVVGVPDATKKIRNGQQIMVDGSTGLVYLNHSAR